MTNKAFARIKIGQLLEDTDRRVIDGLSVRYEYPLDDGGRADHALFDRRGHALAVLEVKSTSVSLSVGEAQGRRYANLLDVPFIFLSNSEKIQPNGRQSGCNYAAKTARHVNGRHHRLVASVGGISSHKGGHFVEVGRGLRCRDFNA